MKNSYRLQNPLRFLFITSIFLIFSSCEKVNDNVKPKLSSTKVDDDRSAPIVYYNTGNGYLSFPTRESFESVLSSLDDLQPDETIDDHLSNWENIQGFSSLRKQYADAEAQGDSSVCPVGDMYFATLLSPEGTVQISEKIYKLDFAAGKVTYIPEDRYSDLYSSMSRGSYSDDVNYYYLNEDVLDLVDAGDQGTSARNIRIGSGIGCAPGAAAQVDDDYDYIDSDERLKCNVEYQKYGLYFSLLAKVKYQNRFLRVWFAKKACMSIIANPGAYWREKCLNTTDSDFGSTANACSDNTAVRRYYEGTRGLNLYQVGVVFGCGGFRSRRYYINQ
ncbi:hypothetical protein [Hymenobacter sp.]|jgi:hypothetical protein|uniref:hypothetical protein n=1 Tax=Hymenobacter sp. TaxID=1898978 RepID=UPI002EDAD194